MVGYDLTGGDSTPGNVGIYDSTAPKNTIGYGLCIIFIGAPPCHPSPCVFAPSFCASVPCTCSAACAVYTIQYTALRCALKGIWLHVLYSCAAGIFVNLSVRKPLVIDYKLPYPTGTATGVMINSFFTNGDLAKQQVTGATTPC